MILQDPLRACTIPGYRWLLPPPPPPHRSIYSLLLLLISFQYHERMENIKNFKRFKARALTLNISADKDSVQIISIQFPVLTNYYWTGWNLLRLQSRSEKKFFFHLTTLSTSLTSLTSCSPPLARKISVISIASICQVSVAILHRNISSFFLFFLYNSLGFCKILEMLLILLGFLEVLQSQMATCLDLFVDLAVLLWLMICLRLQEWLINYWLCGSKNFINSFN